MSLKPPPGQIPKPCRRELKSRSAGKGTVNFTTLAWRDPAEAMGWPFLSPGPTHPLAIPAQGEALRALCRAVPLSPGERACHLQGPSLLEPPAAAAFKIRFKPHFGPKLQSLFSGRKHGASRFHFLALLLVQKTIIQDKNIFLRQRKFNSNILKDRFNNLFLTNQMKNKPASFLFFSSYIKKKKWKAQVFTGKRIFTALQTRLRNLVSCTSQGLS